MAAGDKSDFSQVDQDNNKFGTRNTDGGIHVILTTDGQEKLTAQTTEGETSLHVVQGHDNVYSVNVLMQTIAANTGALLIDLTNVNTWPHPSGTGHASLKYNLVDMNPSTSFRGDVLIGFLTNVVGANGGIIPLEQYHFEQGTGKISRFNNYIGSHLEAIETRHFGPVIANITGFGTNAPVRGPDGIHQHFVADGDVVIYITATSGNIDVSVTTGYKTFD